LLLAVLLAGCGGVSYRTAPVSGRVTLDSKPLPGALVQFVPEGGTATAPLPSSVGTTDEDGRYTLVLNGGGNAPGAVVGKHKVMITLGAQGGANEAARTFHKQLPARYNRQTELVCDVPAAGRGDADFGLRSK
jgi:hypothetical protein